MLRQIQVADNQTYINRTEQQLDMALDTIDKLQVELREQHARHLVMTVAYAKLAEVVREYMADPHAKSRSLVEFYLAKAPK